MEERDWQIIKTLYEQKNITKTARVLYMSQPTLTARIKQIEESLGTKLLYRGNKGITFTETGEYTVKFAEHILGEMQELRETITNMQEDVAGTLRIAAPSILARYFLPKLLGRFQDMYPKTKFDVQIAQSSDVISLEGVAPTKKPAVPIIAVPTTAGTAAEVTINYVITDTSKNRKMVCVDPHDIPVVAVVDPDMMSSMPKGLTAATGMDALTHAIEGYITAGAWELSDMFHLKAIEIISKSLRGAVENTPEGREGMALGQYIAGMGFSNVGLGIVHSMAHPLGALYDTPHGVANAIILPTVMEYNAPATGEKYRDIAKAMGVKGTDDMTQEEYRKAAVDAVRKLSQDVGIPANLKDIVKEEDIPFLAQSAYDDACRPGNPRETSVEEITELYKSLI